jgi:predicted aldo/keto reductase-like oxidoreductase
MEAISFGRTQLVVSRIAFGGIPIQRLTHSEGVALVCQTLDEGVNFIDTAHGYGHSEELIGEALQGKKRTDVILSSKSPALDKAGFLSDLDESLRRLRTDYIDIFQHHNISSADKVDKVLGPDGAFEGLAQAIKQGKVRFPAFSSHIMSVAAQMIKTDRFDVVQVPFNFIDCQALEEVIPLAWQRRMGVIAMKPLGGGLLDNARLCFRYLSQFPDLVPDPGIERIEELREIIAVAHERGPLTEEENKAIDDYRRLLGKTWCHRCDYCQPCPQDIPISMVLAARSFARRMPFDAAVRFLAEPFKKSADCTECRTCVERCPYGLDIPVLLRQRRASWEVFLRDQVWN